MKYDLKTTVFPDGCVVNVHSPQLSEDERAKAVADLKEAAQRYARICLVELGRYIIIALLKSLVRLLVS